MVAVHSDKWLEERIEGCDRVSGRDEGGAVSDVTLKADLLEEN